MSVAQLKFINDEYQSHSTSIKCVLQKGIGTEISSLESFVFDFSNTFNHTSSFSDTIVTIINSLKLISEVNVGETPSNPLEKMESLKDLYSMKSEREVFNEVFGVVEEVEDEEDIELF